MTQEHHTCPIRTIHHSPGLLAGQLRPTATAGCLQAPPRSLKTAVFSTLGQRAPPQRCAIAGRGLNGGIYASVWRCRRARLRHASISRTPPVRLRWSSTDRYGRLLGGAPDRRPSGGAKSWSNHRCARARRARARELVTGARKRTLPAAHPAGDTGLHAHALNRRLLSCAPALPAASVRGPHA